MLDIVAQKSLKLRGQAFIVFRDISSATTALKALQNFGFYDKAMVRFLPPWPISFPFAVWFARRKPLRVQCRGASLPRLMVC